MLVSFPCEIWDGGITDNRLPTSDEYKRLVAEVKATQKFLHDNFPGKIAEERKKVSDAVDKAVADAESERKAVLQAQHDAEVKLAKEKLASAQKQEAEAFTNLRKIDNGKEKLDKGSNQAPGSVNQESKSGG